MKFTIEETGKLVSIAVIMKDTKDDFLRGCEEVLSPDKYDHDLRDLPIKKGRVVISEREFIDVCLFAEAILGDQNDSYITYRGFKFPDEKSKSIIYTESKMVQTRYGW